METSRKQITQEQLKERIHYNKDTGILTWKNSSAWNIKDGHIAGTLTSYGYIQINIKIDGIALLYRAHRLAWLYEHGEFPRGQIDHINHNRSDNRLCNLRDVTHMTNKRNQPIRRDNKSGFTGVVWAKSIKRWLASITVDGKMINLGCYKDKNEAICAKLHANRLYKFHANHGK